MQEQRCSELIKQIHCAMQKNTNNDLRARDLTFAQVHLLFTLKKQEQNCCLMKELERKMGVAQSTVAGLVRRCADKGLVDCREDTADRRAKYVCVTPKGLSVCDDTVENIRRSEERMVQLLTPEEASTLEMLLDKVYLAVSSPTAAE